MGRMVPSVLAAVLLAAATGCVPYNDNANAGITREQFDRDSERYEREAKEAGSKIGSGVNDLLLWANIRAALASAEDLRDVTVNVDVDNYDVTLTGTVGSDAQKRKAEQIARGVGAVREVKNQLAVTGGGS